MLYVLDLPKHHNTSAENDYSLSQLQAAGKPYTLLSYDELPAEDAAPGPVWIRFRMEAPEKARQCLETCRNNSKRQIILTGVPAVKFWLNQGADFLINGPEHHTLIPLLNCLEPPINPFLDRVPGLVFKNALGNVVINPGTEPD
jgi:hypothetical protein